MVLCYYALALVGYITSLLFSISIRTRKKKLGSRSISFLVYTGRSPRKMLLCLSASRIYNTFSISIRSQKKKIRRLFYVLSGSPRQKSWHDVIMPEGFQDIQHVKHFAPQPKNKKKIGCCSICFLVHPSRSPGMMLLRHCASRIYNTFSILISSRIKKKKGYCSISFLVHPGRSPSIMLLFLSASRIYNTISIFIRSRKKKKGYCSIFFLVLPGRSPGKMFLFLNASRIYNTFSIFIRSEKKNYAFVLYPFWFTQVEVLA